MPSARNPDFLVIGGGVIGLSLALGARRRNPASSIVVIEKEKACGLHASGRNSGVLHAGFYYTADSLKARFCREGNLRLTEYCRQRGLRINRCGKLVVARDRNDLTGLQELLERGRRNGVELYQISEKEAREIEPRVKTHEQALWSPTTSSVDPSEVMNRLVNDARTEKIEILTDTAYISRTSGKVRTSRGDLSPGYVINCAGLYADKIARDYGLGWNHRILPFKGLYLYSGEPPGSVKTNVYPVPDLKNPFLGVHYTLTVDGKAKIGPTAIPAFWREHYAALGNFKLRELVEVIASEVAMLVRNDFNFRALAINELQKYSKAKMVAMASELLATDGTVSGWSWGKPGIRAQLFDVRTKKLEMDFHYESDERSFHVLNAVSPAFTCALAFAPFLFDQIETGQTPSVQERGVINAS